MKKIVISAGPIPGRLDSVKYITNRFKGGLTFKLAKKLYTSSKVPIDITIVKWKYTDMEATWGDIKIVNIEDVNEYMEYMTTNEFDAYILAGAVANLIPVNPWKGKFPSHNYKVGEEFDIKFTIAPRIIDEIKKKFPRSTLIGYKLFDGSEEELIEAGWETLINSRANAIFCNTPQTAKTEKIMILSDGSIHKMTFDEHVEKIKEILNLEWYKTTVSDIEDMSNFKEEIDKLSYLLEKIKVKKEPYEFGTVAHRLDMGTMITTTRGKREDGFCKVFHVNHDIKTIFATHKATLNSPFLAMLFYEFGGEIIVHGHKQIENFDTIPYVFDGTTQYFDAIKLIKEKNITEFNVENHGYYKLFSSFEEAKNWIDGN